MGNLTSKTFFSWKHLFLATFSGALLALSFPKVGLAALAWIALIPLLFSIEGQKPKRAFHLGLAFGLAHYSILLYWIAGVMHNYGNLPLVASVAALLLLVIYLSLYTATFSYFVAFTKMAGLSPVITAPILWVSLEYLRSKLLTGFPWENISYSQYANLYFIQICDLLGDYGLSFYIVFVNATLTHFVQERHRLRNGIRPLRPYLMALLAISLLYWGYGAYRVRDIEEKVRLSPKIGTAVIQGNIKQDFKWSPRWQTKTIETYGHLSQTAADGFKTDLIIWPETAVPFYFQDISPLSATIWQLSNILQTNLLFGAPAYVREEKMKPAFFNSAYLLPPGEGSLDRYDKVHLVPFGEYVPARSLLPFADKLVGTAIDFTPGRDVKPLTTGQLRIGTLICFESIFPELARAQVRNGANLLVNITNDAWFNDSSAPYQHMSMAVFRAVENRVGLARAANTGVSMFVSPTGKITQATTLFTTTFLREKVALLSEQTIYNRLGDFFPAICVILGIMIISYTLWRVRTCPPNSKPR